MAKHCFEGAHLETEKGFAISRTEFRRLKKTLVSRGFAFLKKSVITDFVVPNQGETTRRMRIEKIEKAADGQTGIRCIRCFKNHPISGRPGRYVRMEDEKFVKPHKALAFIFSMVDKLEAPLPFYSKKRTLYRGVYEGFETTISLDRAYGLGKFSGCYIEIETILALDCKPKQVRQVLSLIDKLAVELLGEKRDAKISYRKMLRMSWPNNGKRRKSTSKKVRKAKTVYRDILSKAAISK